MSENNKTEDDKFSIDEIKNIAYKIIGEEEVEDLIKGLLDSKKPKKEDYYSKMDEIERKYYFGNDKLSTRRSRRKSAMFYSGIDSDGNGIPVNNLTTEALTQAFQDFLQNNEVQFHSTFNNVLNEEAQQDSQTESEEDSNNLPF